MRPGTLAVLLTLAACGKSSSLADAPVIDGAHAADAAPPVDADQHVVVTVYDLYKGTLAPGVTVAFIEANGTTTAEVMTDANGVASALVQPGASVTAAYTAVDSLVTVVGVQPGDHITINPYGPITGVKVGTFHVVVPDQGDTSYVAAGPCGVTAPVASAGTGMATTIDLEIDADCQESTMDLVVEGLASDGSAAGWVHLAGVAYTDGGMATMPSTGWSPMLAPTATFTNVPADVTSARFNDWVPDENGFTVGFATTATPTTTINLNSLPGAATVQLYSGFAGNGSQRDLYDVVAGNTTTHTVDASTELLPEVSAPTLDIATGAVHVAMSAAPTGAAQYTDLNYTRTVGTTQTSFYWGFLSAPTTDFTLPPLPSDLAILAPTAGDTIDFTDAGVNDATTITTWDEARHDADGAFAAYYLGRAPIGRMRASYTTSNPGLAPHRMHARRRR